MKKLLIVVDMQKDFIDGSLGTAEAVAIVDNVASYIEKCEREDFKIVFTRDTHGEDYMETQEGRKLPVVHCIKDTEGWQIDKKLRKYAEDKRIFDKPTFGSVELMNYVIEHDYDEIHLLGLCTDICVISNAMLVKAALPEARICVVESCSAGVTPDSHSNALEAMKSCQIEII
ncbi:MAG: cysteine hydrolase [Lachnospiraceae bacterium]|nr:cysteine hydrolase [Lachnospiraceae bacterium]